MYKYKYQNFIHSSYNFFAPLLTGYKSLHRPLFFFLFNDIIYICKNGSNVTDNLGLSLINIINMWSTVLRQNSIKS